LRESGFGDWSFLDYLGRRCICACGDGGAEEEIGGCGAMGGEAEINEVVCSSDVLIFETADTQIEIDSPGTVNNSGELRLKLV